MRVWVAAQRKRLLLVFGPVALACADAFPGISEGPIPSTEGAITLIGVFALLLRLRMPLTVFVATLPGLFMGTGWLAAWIALYTVARQRSNRPLLVGCGLVSMTLNYLPYPINQPDEVPWDAGVFETSLAAAVACVALGRAISLRNELTARLDELEKSHAREQRLLAEQVLAHELPRLLADSAPIRCNEQPSASSKRR
ncbi:hypothetical protein AB0O76_42175 [Streptomyces sp. NPDC086554]|uniref:hypothetical protein n=1 Tax=Streptomyces sp. NPDC086554 TaxID=3154864 RepID=UPI00343D74EB